MKHHILAIGLSKHQYPFINNLQYAAKDATEFFNLFTNNIGEIGYQKLLTDSEATLSQIRTALGTELVNEVKPDDAFLFFFSGHGATSENDDDKTLSHFLIPFDASEDITNSSISVSYLKDVFDKLPCKIKLIFVDSCFSGAINSKGYNKPQLKKLSAVKTLGNTMTGTGSLVFTASKDNETAIEDTENKNGLFTHFLLEEVQKDRKSESFAIVDIFTPITEQVTKRASERFRHQQTPTLNSHLEGSPQLPTFKKRITISPQTIEIPKNPELAAASFPTAEIQLTDKQQEKIINDLISLILKGREGGNDVEEIIFERFCEQIIKNLKNEWDKIFQEHDGDIGRIPEAVAKFEGASFQLMALGGVVALFGSEKQLQIYAESIVQILLWKNGRAGLIALIAVPEVVIADIVYIIGIISLVRNNLKPLTVLLNTKINDDDGDRAPYPLSAYTHLFYCDALGGYSSKVNDHIREVLKNCSWLTELVPKTDGKTLDLQLHTNFMLVLLAQNNGHRLWPDFGRWNAYRMAPIVKKLKYDMEFRKGFASFLGKNESELNELVTQLFNKIRSVRLDSYGWHSIEEIDFSS